MGYRPTHKFAAPEDAQAALNAIWAHFNQEGDPPVLRTAGRGAEITVDVCMTNVGNSDDCPYSGKIVSNDQGEPTGVQFTAYTPRCEGSGEEEVWNEFIDGTPSWASVVPT